MTILQQEHGHWVIKTMNCKRNTQLIGERNMLQFHTQVRTRAPYYFPIEKEVTPFLGTQLRSCTSKY